MNKEEKFRVALSSIKNILDKNNQSFFLLEGTLLGLHRDNKFIPYDDDIDLGIFYDKLNPKIKDIIISSGEFRLCKEFGKIDISYELLFYHNKTNVSLGIVVNYKIKDDYYYHPGFCGICDTTNEGFCKFGNHIRGLKQVTFYDEVYLIPSNTEEWLMETYGDDYMIPKKKGKYTDALKNNFYKNIINLR